MINLNNDTYPLFIVGIRAHIREAEKTQKEVASRLNLTPANLSSYLCLRTNMPGSVIKNITDLFNRTTEQLVELGANNQHFDLKTKKKDSQTEVLLDRITFLEGMLSKQKDLILAQENMINKLTFLQEKSKS